MFHCITVSLMSYSPEINSEDLEYAGVMKKITEDVGVPRNYSPNPEEQKDENRRKEEQIKQKLVPETEEKKIRKTAALAEMTKHYEEWVSPEIEGFERAD